MIVRLQLVDHGGNVVDEEEVEFETAQEASEFFEEVAEDCFVFEGEDEAEPAEVIDE